MRFARNGRRRGGRWLTAVLARRLGAGVVPARSRRPARAGRAATAVLVAGLVLLGAAAAEAQTSRILVGNSAQSADDSASTSGNKHAQLFHTGGNTNGYILTSVRVNSEDAENDPFDVEVCEEDGTTNEFPSTTASDCTALTAPATFTTGVIATFTHTGLALSANTNYVVVVTQRGTASVELNTTTSSGEDTSLGLSDWSIKNKFYWQSGSTWMLKSGANEALRIIVSGYANTVADATDATLSALSVSGATLSPAFGAATTTPEEYRAVVANAVSQGTITATTSETTATVEYLDDSDAALTDVDTMTAGLQHNLSVGTNTVKVKVTAPDTTTTKTYIVDVFRIAVPVACSPASMANRIWTGNLTVGTPNVLAVGYSSIAGNLDDTTISFGGTDYTIEGLIVDSIQLQLNLGDAQQLGTAANDLVFHVGAQTYAFADATYSSAQNAYAWYTNVPTWADGNAVCLALTADGPEVSSVALTSTPGPDNTYAIGDAVTATVTFDAAVDITGTPQLELDFDGTAKAAACTTATNTTTMVCSYTVGGRLGPERRRDRGEHAHRRHDLRHRQHDHHRRPRPQRRGDRRRAHGRRHPPDARHHRQRCADDVDRRRDGVAGVQRGHRRGRRTKITIGIGRGNSRRQRARRAWLEPRSLNSPSALVIDATVTLTVELAADAVEDTAENGNLAVAATTVTNAYVPTPPGRPAAPSVTSVAGRQHQPVGDLVGATNTGPASTPTTCSRQGTSGNFTDGPPDQTGTSATITGLTANTLYQVQVRATNSASTVPGRTSGSGQTNSAGQQRADVVPLLDRHAQRPREQPRQHRCRKPRHRRRHRQRRHADLHPGGRRRDLEITIVSTSGQIRTRSGVTYDYETTSSYTVIVKADDGNGGTDTVTVTIDLTDDVDERPLAPAAPRVTATPDTTDSLTVSWSVRHRTPAGRTSTATTCQYREGTTGSWTDGPHRRRAAPATRSRA